MQSSVDLTIFGIRAIIRELKNIPIEQLLERVEMTESIELTLIALHGRNPHEVMEEALTILECFGELLR